MSPSIKEFYDVIDLTWPSVSNQLQNGWLIKNGGGGGKRVSATIRVNPNAKIEIAESLMENINLKSYHKAQLSVIFPGYPKPRAGDSEASFEYRLKRDAGGK